MIKSYIADDDIAGEEGTAGGEGGVTARNPAGAEELEDAD
jgi:hypothetical protein